MCRECGYYPCVPRCPNYNEHGSNCGNCSAVIPHYEDCYADSFGNLFCSKDCFEEFYGLHEVFVDEYEN